MTPTRQRKSTDAEAATHNEIRPLLRRTSGPRQVWGPNGALILPWRPRDRRAPPARRNWLERVLLALGLRTQRVRWTEHDIRAFELQEQQRQARDELGQRWLAHNDSHHVWSLGKTITVWFKPPAESA